MSERLRDLERATRLAPDDLRALRALADERKRRGLELLPARIYATPLEEFMRAFIRFVSLRLGVPLAAVLEDFAAPSGRTTTRRLPHWGSSFAEIVRTREFERAQTQALSDRLGVSLFPR